MPGGKNKTVKPVKDKKRKVISPLSTDITQPVEKSGKTGSTSGQTNTRAKQNEVSKQQKRFHSSTGHFNFDFTQVSDVFSVNTMAKNINTNANMDGNNFPQTHFGTQYMQPPASFTPQFNCISSPTPSWATEIMEDIKVIKKSVSKIDSIEKTVNKIILKVDNLETKVKNMDTRLLEVESSCSYASDEIDSTKKNINTATKDIGIFKNKFDENVKNFEAKTQELDTKLNDLEARSMRENLLFYGFKENDGENCEDLILDLIKTKLEIDSNISLDRVHRIGKPKDKGNRPIVAKFHNYKDRELVRITSFNKQTELRALNLGVGVQQTKSTMEKRRPLYSVMNREKDAGNIVKWAGSKLLVRSGSGGKFHEVTN